MAYCGSFGVERARLYLGATLAGLRALRAGARGCRSVAGRRLWCDAGQRRRDAGRSGAIRAFVRAVAGRAGEGRVVR